MKVCTGYITEPLGALPPEAAFGALSALPLPFLFSAREDSGGGLYTYAGAAPSVTVVTDPHGLTTIIGNNEKRTARDPFYALSEIIKERGCNGPGPFPFSGGAAGYFAYDLKNILDGPNRGTLTARERYTELNLPLCIAGIYDTIYVYDHRKKEAWSVSRKDGIESGEPGTKESKVRSVLKTARLPERQKQKSLVTAAPDISNTAEPAALPLQSNTTHSEHIAAIKRALEYISAGDIYQINLSHRLTLPLTEEPFKLFKRVTEKSPAPFASYFDAGEFQILSNSPERLLSVKEDVAMVEPIKGTRPRGTTAEEDARFVEELKESRKEKAEHVMIVDLERNDLGRVSVPGGVKVTDFEQVVTLPGLHHMVSTVEATVRDGIDSLGVLRAVFPGGSITGAPKVRAMEIIDELEQAPRSIYTGGIGWIDYSGDLDISMAIRTAVAENGKLRLSVGGGIVADSDPEAEYEETILKAKDFIELTRNPAHKERVKTGV